MTDTNDTTQTDETDSTDPYSDLYGLTGAAVEVDRVETDVTVPGIIRGATDVIVDDEVVATRVLVDVEDSSTPIDTDADRVEVL